MSLTAHMFRRLKFLSLAMFGLIASLMIGTAAASAAESDLGTHKNWRALKVTEDGRTYCYMISAPQESNPKGVRRGPINFFVSKVPAAKETEFNVQMGYPLAEKASSYPLTARIGNTHVNFKTELQDGWAKSKDVPTLVKAMKRGATMTVSGISRRGTKTADIYSLSGFTAAYNAISKACNM